MMCSIKTSTHGGAAIHHQKSVEPVICFVQQTHQKKPICKFIHHGLHIWLVIVILLFYVCVVFVCLADKTKDDKWMLKFVIYFNV